MRIKNFGDHWLTVSIASDESRDHSEQEEEILSLAQHVDCQLSSIVMDDIRSVSRMCVLDKEINAKQ